MKLPPAIPSVFLGLALIGAAVLIVWGKQIAAPLEPEVFKLLAQLVLLAGIGGSASLLYREIERSRRRRDEECEVLRRTMSELIDAYNECKCVRRLLRAQAICTLDDGKETVDRDSYSSLLTRLNDVQLHMEFYKKYIGWNQDLFAGNCPIFKQLETAEKYLGYVISEWEKQQCTLSEDQSKNLLDQLPNIKNFTASAKTGFSANVADPFELALKTLSESIEKRSRRALT